MTRDGFLGNRVDGVLRDLDSYTMRTGDEITLKDVNLLNPGESLPDLQHQKIAKNLATSVASLDANSLLNVVKSYNGEKAYNLADWSQVADYVKKAGLNVALTDKAGKALALFTEHGKINISTDSYLWAGLELRSNLKGVPLSQEQQLEMFKKADVLQAFYKDAKEPITQNITTTGAFYKSFPDWKLNQDSSLSTSESSNLTGVKVELKGMPLDLVAFKQTPGDFFPDEIYGGLDFEQTTGEPALASDVLGDHIKSTSTYYIAYPVENGNSSGSDDLTRPISIAPGLSDLVETGSLDQAKHNIALKKLIDFIIALPVFPILNLFRKLNGDGNGNGYVIENESVAEYRPRKGNVDPMDGDWEKIESACRSAGITFGLVNSNGQIQPVVTKDGTFVRVSNSNGKSSWKNLKDGKENNKVNDYAEILSGVEMEARVKVDGLPFTVTSQSYGSISLPYVLQNGDVSFNKPNRVSGLILDNQEFDLPRLVASVRIA